MKYLMSCGKAFDTLEQALEHTRDHGCEHIGMRNKDEIEKELNELFVAQDVAIQESDRKRTWYLQAKIRRKLRELGEEGG